MKIRLSQQMLVLLDGVPFVVNVKIGGRWNDHEIQSHINFLELLAVNHAIKSFCKVKTNLHVRILSDNSCTVAHIRNLGGIQKQISLML